MPDLAELGLRIKSDEVAVADDRLEDFAAAAGRAEASADRLAGAARRSDGAAGAMNIALRQQRRALDAVRGVTGLTAQESLNLSRQFADVGVSLASGQNPFLVAIQQGAQIGDTFQTAAMRGVGFRAVLGSIYSMLAPILAFLGPIAIGVAAVGGAFALMTRQANADNHDLVASLGLTDDQLKKLKKSGEETSISLSDAFKSFGTTVKEVLAEAFGTQIEQAQTSWNSFLDDLTANTAKETRAILGFFIGSYNAVVATWGMLPAAFGDATVQAANASITAINWLIERAAAGVNALRAQYNALPAWLRGGQSAPMLTAPQAGLLGNPNAGALSNAMGAGRAAYGAGQAQAAAMVDGFNDQWNKNMIATAGSRLSAAAGDAAGGAARARRDRQARDLAGLLRRGEGVGRDNLRPFDFDVPSLAEPLRLIADEMRLINEQANEMAQGLTSAFGESGRALGDLLTTMSGYQSRLADINLAEREHQLTAAQAVRERSFAQIKSYGDMAGAARGFFEEGSDGYRTLMAVEQVYRAFQLAGMMQSMLMGSQETAFTVGQNVIRAASHGVVAAARALASLPFPLNIAAMGATLAALAGIGVKLSGGGSKGGSSLSDSVATAQAQSGQDAQARDAAATAISSRVQVVVTADRQGMNAYIAKTAEQKAAPMAAGAYQGAVATSREVVPAEQARRQRYRY